MNKQIKIFTKQLAFPLLLILLCYINLQYMHYTVLIDKYSASRIMYLVCASIGQIFSALTHWRCMCCLQRLLQQGAV